jgi:hypothetical protein
MFARSFLMFCFALAWSGTAAYAVDPSSAGVSPRVGQARPCSARVDRCLTTSPETTSPPTIVYGSLSDHGPGYDAQGNAVDYSGNIVAVPEGRAGSEAARQVFASERRW